MTIYNIDSITNSIKDEASAIEFLKVLLRPDTEIELNEEDFDKLLPAFSWSSIEMHVEEVPIDATITPTIMEAYQTVQASLYQIAGIVEYGVANATKLSKTEKDQYELYVVVSPGSSKQKTFVDEILVKLAKKALGKMDGKQTLIFLVVAALSLGGYFGFTAHLATMKEIKIAEAGSAEHIAMLKSMDFQTEKNAENMKLLADAVRAIPRGEEIDARIKAANGSLVKAASETKGGIDIKGHNLSKEEAKSLVKKKRRDTVEIFVTKDVKILGISRDGATKITYEDPDDLTVYEVEVKDPVLLAEHGEALASAVLSTSVLRIRIQAKDKEGEIIPEQFLGIGDLAVQGQTARN